jgi:hypothetical protein
MKRRSKLYLSLPLIACAAALCFSASSRAERYSYASLGKRDPFVPLVGVAGPATGGGLRGVTSVSGIKLQGILIGADGKRAAIVNGEIFSEGYAEGDVSILSIAPGKIRVKINDKEHDVSLYK